MEKPETRLPSECPFCGGPNIRHWFTNTPRPLTWCLDCMFGKGSAGHGPIIDMHVFESAIEEKQQYDAARKAEEERKEALRIPYFKAYVDIRWRGNRYAYLARTPEQILGAIQQHAPRLPDRRIKNLTEILSLLDSGDSLEFFNGPQDQFGIQIQKWKAENEAGYQTIVGNAKIEDEDY